MTIVQAIAAIQDTVGAVTGIRVAPDYAPDNLSIFPASVVYPRTGTIDSGPAGNMKALHNFVIEIHVDRMNLQKDLARVIPFGDSIPEALLDDPTIDGTISTFGVIDYTFGPMTWGDIPTIGWRFVVNACKLQTDIT
jgi:hypothetical protein